MDLSNPILVSLEVSLVEDIIKIIGQSTHSRFSHADISAIEKILILKKEEAINDSKE